MPAAEWFEFSRFSPRAGIRSTGNKPKSEWQASQGIGDCVQLANSVTGNSKTAITASVAANSALQPFMLLCRFGPRAGLAIPRQTFVRRGQCGWDSPK
jgi:hypothetical protein